MYVSCRLALCSLLLLMMMRKNDGTCCYNTAVRIEARFLCDKLPRFLFTLVAVATRDLLQLSFYLFLFLSSFPPCQSHCILPPSSTLPHHCLQLLIALTLYPSCSASLSLFISLDTYLLSRLIN